MKEILFGRELKEQLEEWKRMSTEEINTELKGPEESKPSRKSEKLSENDKLRIAYNELQQISLNLIKESQEFEDETYTLQAEIDDLESRNYDLEDEIDELKKKIQRLEEGEEID